MSAPTSKKDFHPLIKLALTVAVCSATAFGLYAFGVFGDTTIGVSLNLGSSSLEDGLVAHWTFDGEDMDNGVEDTSGNGYTGTLAGFAATTTVPGKIGQALQFDGSNDEITLPLAPFNYEHNYSITAWVWITPNTGGNRTIMKRGESNESFPQYRIQANGAADTLRFVTSNGVDTADADAFGNLPEGEWVHVACVEDNSTKRCYANGSQSGSDATNDVTYGSTPTEQVIGGGGHWNGYIDDVRFYGRVLSASEIKKLYNLGATTHIGTTIRQGRESTLADGLVGHWTFDGPDMLQNATDRSGSGNTGYLTGFTSTTTVQGVIGQALEFDGSGNAVNIESADAYLNDDAQSFSAWIKPSSTGTIFSGGVEVGNGSFHKLSIVGTNTLEMRHHTDGVSVQYITNDNTINLNEWQHVVMTWDGIVGGSNCVHMYINGVESNYQTSDCGTGTASDVSLVGTLYLGRIDGLTPVYYSGVMDDIRVYKRALSAREVKQLYNLGATTHLDTTIKPKSSLDSGLIGHWTFDGPDMLSNATDVSGNAHTGYLTGFTSTTTYPGVIGQGLSFDGNNDWVAIGNSVDSFETAPMTASIWLKLDALPSARGEGGNLFHKVDNSSPFASWLLRADSTTDKLEFIVVNSAGAVSANVLSNNAITANTWYHVVATLDSSYNMAMYVDGVKQTDTDNIGSILNADDELRIGSFTDADGRVLGTLDDARIYNRVLSADEIKRLYDLGR